MTTTTEPLSEKSAGKSSDKSSEDDEWLKQAAKPGMRSFTFAAVLLVLQDVLQAGQWAGLALVTEGVILHHPVACYWGIGAMLVGGLAAVVAAHAARRAALRGRSAVATGLRDRLVVALLPARETKPAGEPAAAAHATLELADQIADYHAAVLPLRRQAPISMVIIAAAIVVVNWPAALVLGVSSALIPVNMKLAGVLAKDSNDHHLTAMNRMSGVVLDSFRGLHTLVALGAVARRRRDIAVASDELSRTNLDVLKRAFLSGAIMDLVVTFSMAVDATYIGLSLLHYVSIPSAPALTLFSGLFILLLCPMFFTPLRRAAAAFHDRERAVTASRAVRELLDRPAATLPEVATEQPLPDAPIGVALEGVVVRAGDNPLFQVDRLHAEPGTWTAITGISGAGKTTLLSVIAGLRPASSGSVAWIRDDLVGTSQFVSEPTPGTTAWIGQSTVILEDTIAANIRLGRADASDEEVLEAASAAGLDSVIDRVGLDMVVGDGGWGLSAGEARRVAAARAVLSKARLWILDEPTSHLDATTEETVLDALASASAGATVLVATHSPAVVERCQAMWRIVDGRVETVPVPAVAS